jgi:predicted nucleic acid-binding Zn ribbon protein
MGRWIEVQLAEVSTRRCAAPSCHEPLTGRGGQQYCSDRCRQAARDSSAIAPRSEVVSLSAIPRSEGVGLALPDTPISRSNGALPPGTTHPDIADTADPERRCVECGRDLTGKKAGARFCGDSCRKKLARRAATIAARAELADLLGRADRRRSLNG